MRDTKNPQLGDLEPKGIHKYQSNEPRMRCNVAEGNLTTNLELRRNSLRGAHPSSKLSHSPSPQPHQDFQFSLADLKRQERRGPNCVSPTRMSTLRSLRSITSLFDSKHNNHHAATIDSCETTGGTVRRHRLRKTPDHNCSHPTLLSEATPRSTFTLRNQHSEHPLTEFRRRLARKASTFSLRTRRRQGERGQNENLREEEKRRELVSVGSDKGSVREPLEQEPSDTTPKANKVTQQDESWSQSNRRTSSPSQESLR